MSDLTLDPILMDFEGVDQARLTPDELEHGLILASRELFRVFARIMHEHLFAGVPWDEQPLHQEIFDFLERAFTEPGFGGIINIAPRSGKTQLVCSWIAWCFGKMPDSEFIYTTFSNDLSETNAMLVRQIMTTELYMKIFPKTRIDRNVNAREKFHTTARGKMLARGIEGTITGYGAGRYVMGDKYVFKGCAIADDLHKPGEAASDTQLGAVKRFYTDVFSNRINDKKKTPLIIIGQRVAVKDITGLLMGEDGSKSISSRKFEKLAIKSMVNNESAWEGRWPIAQLRIEQEVNPWTFATQSQQQPYNERGATFRVDRMPVITVRPAGLRIACRSWDLAARKLKLGKTEPDFTAKVMLVYYPDARLYVIEDAQMYRDTAENVRKDIRNTAHRDGLDPFIWIPQDPAQAGVAQVEDLTAMLTGYKVKSGQATTDKALAADPFAAQFNVGLVACLAPYAELVRNQLLPFPDGAHDDLVDALSGAFRVLAIPDEDERARREAVANIIQMGQYTFDENLNRTRVDEPETGPVDAWGEL
jgi:predicted phage terminase large subunit-like protein